MCPPVGIDHFTLWFLLAGEIKSQCWLTRFKSPADSGWHDLAPPMQPQTITLNSQLLFSIGCLGYSSNKMIHPIYILLSQLLSFVFRVLPILASVFAYMKHLTRTLQGRPVPFLCVICKFEHFFAPTSHFPSNGWNAWCVFDYLVFHGSIQNQCVSQDAAVFGEGEKHHCSLLLHLDS